MLELKCKLIRLVAGGKRNNNGKQQNEQSENIFEHLTFIRVLNFITSLKYHHLAVARLVLS